MFTVFMLFADVLVFVSRIYLLVNYSRPNCLLLLLFRLVKL